MAGISRRAFLSGAFAGGVGLALAGVAAHRQHAQKNAFNVLFVAIDDLRPELGCYGSPTVKSPHIDRLASRGLLFERAYSQQAVCNPSRASLLTGRRPDTTKVYDLETNFRTALPGIATLPQHFKSNGYFTQCFGKIFHDGIEDEASWSAPKYPARNAGMQYIDTARLVELKKERGGDLTGVEIPTTTWKKRESWQAVDVPDNSLQDGKCAELAVEALSKLKNDKFFLALGFQKPHLPFVAPQKYFDLYPPETIKPADNPDVPKDSPPIALHPWTELRGYADIPKTGPLGADKQRELIRGYYASTSYADAQLGRVLDELDRLKLTDKTIVVLWGDHGFHLGEHNLWAKTSNFELDARAPFILSSPDQKTKGAKTRALVELVDIYPSLCELCGLPTPDGLEGTSVVPLLEDPEKKWKKAAFTQFPRTVPESKQRVMGRTVRTDRYRYTEWAEDGKVPVAVELYDHRRDPNETANIAYKAENKKLVRELSGILRRNWQDAKPRR
ncbi:MAG TPA: sulfatase [Pyrinomonadaceae bacterium]|jgi:arylsulfatase A-like enzyme